MISLMKTQQIPTSKLARTFAFMALASIALVIAFATPAFAATKDAGWTVTLDANGQMTSDYAQKKASIDGALNSLLPGDTFNLNVALRNDNEARTSWYMTNKALRTLEDASKASNGAYEYKLSFNDNVIYESKTVGGDDSDGFMSISDSTGDWFWLGYIDSGQSGNVTIQMKLDGETQDNSYMSTFGSLSVSFAVEFNDGAGRRFVEEGQVPPAPQTSADLQQTGDMIALVAAALLAVVAAAGAIALLSRKRRTGKGSDSR